MRTGWLAVSVVVLAAALAFAGGAAAVVYVNGVRTTDVVVRGGKPYVSLEVLQRAGAEVARRPDGWSVQFIPVGGRMQVDAVEGVGGEWVSNGTWRVRVSEVQEVSSPHRGYTVRLEVRNLGRRAQSLHATGLDKVQLVDSNDNILVPLDWDERYRNVPPAGGFTVVLQFLDTTRSIPALGQPAKLLVLFRPFGGSKALPHFRIALRRG